MDGLLEELLRLETAKHKALLLIDAFTYDLTVREQMELLATSKNTLGACADIERLLTLSQLITLNTRLLQNLLSTSPLFNAGTGEYTAQGGLSITTVPSRVSVEV